jgi:hypothetical protein
MDVLSRRDVLDLLETGRPPCVSVFLPTHGARTGADQDPIRLKNLLARAEEGLLRSGLRSAEARSLLAPALRSIDDAGFWRSQSEGLAALPPARGFFRTGGDGGGVSSSSLCCLCSPTKGGFTCWR